ncbi:hypothetical protein N7492_007594 [Penicillium capsulatum]|uniref:Myb-like domain-containing protein n=1 Tax=Penicillium capsulatum TaxID=69766 RepID=A0A9W9I055_9EURO|nr:hypothetical protein N7492_007594 [Penicillium capsulatum]KAJ6117429.1 hypothetical protein N7512_007154 [Penicillium capsulatum]
MARVTRSQSRERESPGIQNEGTKSAGNQKVPSDRLPTVTEESPQTPRRKNSKAAVVPESPGNHEGHSALSGPTVVHHASESEDELDLSEMVEMLPYTQHAARRLLDLLISNNSDPMSIFNAAKHARDADIKRVKRHSKELLGRMKSLSQQTFIDVAHLKREIPSIDSKAGVQSWSPTPALYLANCARLSLEILLGSVGSDSLSEAIRTLDFEFPAPFMDQITDGAHPISVGMSDTEKVTFELALEIRTQFFIMELERRQAEPDLSPRSLLKEVFYDEIALERDASDLDSGLLRGFNLTGAFKDENGCLPERFQDDAAERIRELEVELFDDDESLNIQGLRAAFSWKRFALRTAGFLHQREKEIRRDLQVQDPIDEVIESVIEEIERRKDPNWVNPANRRDSVAPWTANRSSRQPSVPVSRAPSREQPVEQTPERRDKRAVHRDSATPSKLTDQDSRAMPPPPRRDLLTDQGPHGLAQGREATLPSDSVTSTPERQRESTAGSQPSPVRKSTEPSTTSAISSRPAVKNSQRRKSAKQYLNVRSISAVTRRSEPAGEQDLSHLGSQYKRQDPGVPDADIVKSPSNAHGGRELPDEIPQPQDTTIVDPEPAQSSWQGQTHRKPRRWFDVPQPSSWNIKPPSSAPALNPQPINMGFERTQEVTESTDSAQPTRRTLYDRQSNAQRISPIGDSESPDPERPPQQAKDPVSRKRGHEEVAESDDEFESTSRDDADIAHRRAQKPHQERRVRPRSEARAETEDAANLQLESSLNASSQNQVVAAPPSSTQGHLLPLAPPSPPAQAASSPRGESAQRNVHGPNQATVVETGKRWWTPERDERLISLIGKYGPKWADILRADLLCASTDGGSKFSSRAEADKTKFQVIMKDRARVLKHKFRREGKPFPENFDLVCG